LLFRPDREASFFLNGWRRIDGNRLRQDELDFLQRNTMFLAFGTVSIAPVESDTRALAPVPYYAHFCTYSCPHCEATGTRFLACYKEHYHKLEMRLGTCSVVRIVPLARAGFGR
jgi:hypothetical protein